MRKLALFCILPTCVLTSTVLRGDPLDDALATWPHFSGTAWNSAALFDQYYQTADWSDKREFELAMVQASYTEYILENASFTNALNTFIRNTDNDELRREGQLVLSERRREYGFADERLTNAPARWQCNVTNFMAHPEAFTNNWLPYLEAGMLIADYAENGRAREGYILGTNLLRFAESVPCTSDSLLWHWFKLGISVDYEPESAIDGVLLATAEAAKGCGELVAASNLVSTLPAIEQKLFWVEDGSVIEINEATGDVTVIRTLQ